MPESIVLVWSLRRADQPPKRPAWEQGKWTVTAIPRDSRYAIDFTFAYALRPTDDPVRPGDPVLLRVCAYRLPGDDIPDLTSMRDIQRLPLQHLADGARAVVLEYEEKLRHGDAASEINPARRRPFAPKGRPQRGRSTKFYREFADSYRRFMVKGVSPIKAIAAEMGEDENTVHQWAHRARKIGVLEPSTRSKRKGTDV